MKTPVASETLGLSNLPQTMNRRGIMLVVLAVAVASGLRADDRQTASSAATKENDAVNIMWRFDGSGRFPGIRPPTEWTNDRNVLWKTPVEVGGYSSPIVVRDKVFVTAEMGSLICLDVADGKLLWKKDLFSKDSPDIPAELSKKLMRGCGGDSKQSTPTPTSNGELVFSINAMGLCACYDLQGHLKWMRVIETAEDEEYFSASPIFRGDRIFLSWGGLLALNAKDGSTLWKAADARTTHGTPAITQIGGVEVAITPAGDIVRLADGEILCAELFQSTFTTPLVVDNVLYVIDTEAQALELPAKTEKGMTLKKLWQAELRGEFMASPIFKDGLIYSIESQKCRLNLLDAKTGDVLTAGEKIAGLATAKFTYASPVATERQLFLFDDAGNTAVMELGRKPQLTRINSLAGGLIGTPFFVNDKIVIRSSQSVFCIGVKQ